MKKILTFGILVPLTLIFTTGCSLDSYATTEGLFGSLAGAVVGGGVGSIIGDKYGKKTENTAIAAAIGAGSGMALGALVHDQRTILSKEKAQVVRKAKHISSRQKEIDDLHTLVYSESSWGRLDIKPWNERYEIDSTDYPFESLPLK